MRPLLAVACAVLAAACGGPSDDRNEPTPRPGLHDHTPHHRGVVGMARDLHLEARAERSGVVSVWLTDFWRRPLPLDAVTGTVTLGRGDGGPTLPLRRMDDRLVADAPPFGEDDVTAHVDLGIDGKRVALDFVLPVRADRAGAAGLPVRGCLPIGATAATRAPRCAIDFGAAVTALATTADGTALLVAAVDRGISTWHLPDGSLGLGFAPPPPVAVPGPEGEQMHPEAATALATLPDGTAVAALEGRLLRWETASGRIVGPLPAPRGVLRALARAPDGATLLVAAFYDDAAHWIRIADGVELATFAVEREAAAVAFAADGRRAVVASEAGPLALVDLEERRTIRLLEGARAPTQAVAVAGRRVVAAGDDGVFRVWDAESGAPVFETMRGRVLAALAVAPGDRLVATGGGDGAVHVYDVADPAPVATLLWHGGPVLALAWAGTTLASGDAQGRVALWDVGDLLAGADRRGTTAR